MARPRIIKWPNDGEIQLKNISPEDCDRIKELLFPVVQPEIVQPTVTGNNIALGIFRQGIAWFVAVIKYDPITKVAVVDSLQEAGPGKDFAIEKFKIIAFQNEII